MSVLKIENLHVSVENKPILKGVNLTINSGDLVALLGPNGNGKSTLFAAIMGNPHYVVTEGRITLDDQDILSLSIDERSKLGLFLGFQNPVDVPGVVSADFYRASINARSKDKLTMYKFYKLLENACKEVGIPFEFVNRGLNNGFSGGERKRNEILQMLLLNPAFAMLDEIDSGLDVDAINTISKCINKQKEKGAAFIIISHYARLFELIQPTKAYVLVDGRIVTSGGSELINRIDKDGYEWIKHEFNVDFSSDSKSKISLGTCITKEASKNDK